MPPQRVHVLVVDDDPCVLESWAGALAALSWVDLEVASTAAEAMICVERAAPDAMVLDYSLPDGDGVRLIERIRAAAGRRVPAILITAHLDGARKAAAHAAGFDGFLLKPVDERELRKILEALVITWKA